jgi:hypothetical protein
MPNQTTYRSPREARVRRRRSEPQRRLRPDEHARGGGDHPAELNVYRRAGLDPILVPRNAGSYPGYVFTGEPLKLPAVHFGLCHGSGAHAPDEYYVIESRNPKLAGWDDAVASFADYLYELAEIS